ncbi:hypothetical protein MLD38_019183 [Melastoma candidum]|uniref:Uncharacterized protein n=1 Tax=Melastoma candidum TaxID=119954 RepID=A0ACB9QWA1_9MYRT|nr:hypothetical protein MLD38_019183 [Melastoma candidum]
MLRTPPSRRRQHPAGRPRVCAVVSAVLFLLTITLLYFHLSISASPFPVNRRTSPDRNRGALQGLDSADDDAERIDVVEEKRDLPRKPVKDSEEEEEEEEEGEDGGRSSGKSYFYDHLTGIIRRAFRKGSIEEWDDDASASELSIGLADSSGDDAEGVFGSDDVVVDESVRRKVVEVKNIEEALLLRGSKGALREGWGEWFEKKGDFLRKERMFRTGMEILNPMNNPMLQDPDGVGVTGLTRGDRLVQKWWVEDLRKVPFPGVKKPLGITGRSDLEGNVGESNRRMERGRGVSDVRKIDRRTLDDEDVRKNVDDSRGREVSDESGAKFGSNRRRSSSGRNAGDDESSDDDGDIGSEEGVKAKGANEIAGHVYPDGSTWGYFPGLHPGLSFSEFMTTFLRRGNCKLRIFMVWNSPPWMFTVRYQRTLESMLSQHPESCIAVLSETIELDFFKGSFVKDGYKVAVAMPNLDELLKDTPNHVFASLWYEWRKTKFYPTHYSELVRLAALYKYGGIYLDFDVIVLKPLSTLNNAVGLENGLDQWSLNGAVMAFNRHSPFIRKCLEEYYVSYDDTKPRWNGADLLTRVAKNFSRTSQEMMDLEAQPPSVFFPIRKEDILRYFYAPSTKAEKEAQEALFQRITSESLAFHFWNSLTSSLVPEQDSLAARLIDHRCMYCTDVL